MANISLEQILELIEIGIHAPSADNHQPWTVRLISDGFELGMDPKGLGKFHDVHRFTTQMACGGFIENVVQFASAQGLATSICFFESASSPVSDDLRVARIEFKQEKPPGDVEGARRAILGRNTNRLFYRRGGSLPQETWSRLSSMSDTNPRYQIIRYSDPKLRKKLIRAIATADTIRFTHRQSHRELYECLRFGDEGRIRRDGLAEETLGMSKGEIHGLKASSSWTVQSVMNLLGGHYLTAFRAGWLPLTLSSEIVSIIHFGRPDFYEFGRVMERFWIRANQLGLSVQPVGTLPIFFARLATVRGEGFSRSQVRKLSRVQKIFAELTPGFDPRTDQLVMNFRLGYSDQAPPRSYRRRIEEFFITE